MTTIHEIVKVCGDGAQRLAPGFYLVLRPAADACGARDRPSRYFGPFGDRALAEKLSASAAYLGIIAATESGPAEIPEAAPAGWRTLGA